MTGKYCGKDKDDRDSKWDFFILANFSHIESLSLYLPHKGRLHGLKIPSVMTLHLP